jgi:hypothetical protein
VEKDLDIVTAAPIHRAIATNNNHQATARKIITVKSFGVGEGSINMRPS